MLMRVAGRRFFMYTGVKKTSLAHAYARFWDVLFSGKRISA
jgi:hypothetical protein